MPRILLSTLFIAAFALVGCRGMESERPPIHPNLNMDYQPKPTAYRAWPMFDDNRAMRQPVPGTVARGLLQEDGGFYRGQTADGGFVTENPVPITRELLERGQNRYEVFCQMCHGLSGDGLGIIMTGGYGYTPAPTFHDDRLRNETDGYLYEVITNGVRNMPGYGYQIPVADRWAIVAYVRALQLSQDATLDAVPDDQRGRLTVAETPAQEDPATADGPDQAVDDPALDEEPPSEEEEL